MSGAGIEGAAQGIYPRVKVLDSGPKGRIEARNVEAKHHLVGFGRDEAVTLDGNRAPRSGRRRPYWVSHVLSLLLRPFPYAFGFQTWSQSVRRRPALFSACRVLLRARRTSFVSFG